MLIQYRPQTSFEPILVRLDTPLAEHLRDPRERTRSDLRSRKFNIHRHIRCRFAQRMPENEIVHHCQQRDLLFIRHRCFRQPFQALLHMAHRIESGRSRQHCGQRPGVADKDCVGTLGDLHNRPPPPFRNRGQNRFAHERVVHHRHQIVFGLHVVIQAHRSGFEFSRHAAHRDCFETLLVGDAERGGGDRLPGQPYFFP